MILMLYSSLITLLICSCGTIPLFSSELDIKRHAQAVDQELELGKFLVGCTSKRMGHGLAASIAHLIMQYAEKEAYELTTVLKFLRKPFMTHTLALSPNNKFLAFSHDGTIKIWNITARTLLHELQGQPHSIYSIKFDSMGTTIASASKDTLNIWDVRTGSLKKTLKIPMICTIAFNPKNTQLLASAASDGSLQVWDIETGTCIKTFDGYVDDYPALVFNPNGESFASGSGEGLLTVWHLNQKKQLWAFDFEDRIQKIAYSPNGKHIAAMISLKIKLIDAVMGKRLRTLDNSHDDVDCTTSTVLFFNQDGSRISSCCNGYTHTWDTETGQCIHTINAHPDNVCHSIATCEPTNRYIASICSKKVMLWSTSNFLSRLLTAYLTDPKPLKQVPQHRVATYFLDNSQEIDIEED